MFVLAWRRPSHVLTSADRRAGVSVRRTIPAHELVTGLPGGGTVGGKNLVFTGRNILVADSGCVPPRPAPCSSFVQFFVGGGNVEVDGFEFGGGEIDVSDDVSLAKPQSAFRVDTAYGSATISYDAKTKILRFSAGTTGDITGSGVFSGGAGKTTKTSCTKGGETHTRVDLQVSGAKFAGKDIAAKVDLVGRLVGPTSSPHGIYDISRTI